MNNLEFKINNPEDYTDNKIGKVIESMNNSGHDCLLVFKNSVTVINKNELDVWILTCYQIKKRDENGYFNCSRVKIECDDNHSGKLNSECHNYIGHRYMNLMRKTYQKYKNKDFPFEDVLFIFPSFMSDMIYID